MKKIPLLLFTFLLVILILRCSNNSNPTGPIVETPIVTGEIGVEGGTFGNDDFSLIIPAGAFTTNSELKLFEPIGKSPFDDNSVTKLYRLEGLPDDYTKPLQLKLKNISSSTDSLFAVIGGEAINAETGETDTLYEFIPAIDSIGYVLSELPVNDGNGIGKYSFEPLNAKKYLLVQHVSAFLKDFIFVGDSQNTQSFQVYFPDYSYTYTNGVMKSIDEALIKIRDDFHLDARFLSSKLVFYVGNLGNDTYCKFKYRNAIGSKPAKAAIAINFNKVEDTDTMNVMIGREICRLYLFGYDPQFPVMVGPSQQTHYWLDQAIISWIEQFFVPGYELAHIPSDLGGNELAPLNGMQAGIDVGDEGTIENARNHGRGMSVFINYLFEQHDDLRDLSFIYQNISQGNHPVKALSNFVENYLDGGYDLGHYWKTFLNNYFLGEVFPFLQGNIFFDNIISENTFKVDNIINISHTFNDKIYPDLSVKLFRIDLSSTNIDPNTVIDLKLTSSDASLEDRIALIYYYQNGKLTYKYNFYDWIGSGSLKTLADNNIDIVIAVINGKYNGPSYKNKSEMQLTVEVKKQVEASIKIQTMSTVKYSDDSVTQRGFTYNSGSPTVRIGTYENNQFESSWNQPYQDGTSEGELNFTVDGYTITDYYVTELIQLPNSTERKTIEGKNVNIPGYVATGGGIQYEITGIDACTNITSIEEIMVHADGLDRELTGFDCNSNSFVRIKLNAD